MTFVEFKENFLPEFQNIRSFAAKIKYANERLNRIGSGSGRIVYDIDGEKVMKLAKNAKGVAQNEAEAGAGYYRDTQHIVTEIFDGADDDSWLISEKGKKVTDRRIRELTGIPSLDKLFDFLKVVESNQKPGRNMFSHLLTDEEKEFFWENEFSTDLADFAINYGQTVGDMGRPSSYGEVLRDGKPAIVLTDYGLNDEVYDTHYNPERKQQYRMYELFNYADGNDDILSDTGDQGDIRRGMWAQIPYSVSDGGDNSNAVINEEFINFVSNRQDYPDKPISSLPTLTDRFHECVNNIGEIMKVVENKGRFYNNLLELQTYLTKQGYYNRDPLLREAYHITEDTPDVQPDTLNDRTYSDKLAKEVAGKLNLANPKYLGDGDNGFAYEINDNVVMKITTDISEADSASKLMRGQPQYLAKAYNLYKVLDTDTNQSFFVIMQENVNDKPLEKFRKIEADIGKLMPAGMDLVDIMKTIKRPDRFDYNQMAGVAKQVLTVNPEAGVNGADREAAYEFIMGILNIRRELLEFEIKSVDYVRISNLGYSDNVLKFFDIGGYFGVVEPDIPDEDVISLPEDGSAKFTTNNAVNQDDFPAYNTNDTSPSINNDLDANIAMYEDLEYNHVVGDATEDKFEISERDKSFGTGSKTVKVKRKCQLAGLGNTSVACNQGDINNLEFGSVNEANIPYSKTYWAWVSPDNKFIEVPKLRHKDYIMQVYKDEEFSWDYDRVFDKALQDGWVRVIFEYETFQGDLNLNGHERKRVISVFKSMFADAVKYGSNRIYLEWDSPERGYERYTTRDAESKAKLAQIVSEEMKNLDLREYFSSLVPANEGVGDKYFQNKTHMDYDADFENKFRASQNQKNKEEILRSPKSGMVLIKNPKSLNSIGPNVRGLIDTEGNLYSEINFGLLHDHIIQALWELDIVEFGFDWKYRLPTDFITVEREGNTNNFYVGESHMTMIDAERRELMNKTGDENNTIPSKEESLPHFQKFLDKAKIKNPRFNFINTIASDAKWSLETLRNIRDEENRRREERLGKEENMNETDIMQLNDLPFKSEVESLGGKIYSVGGAVRDEFLGKESKDLDILITGIPMKNLGQLLSKYGKVNLVGASYGVLKFVPKGGGEEIDIAIPRTEKVSGAGHKDFDVTSDHALPIEKDLERRDFTINAIGKDSEGNIVDPYHGQEDLKNKIIRAVNPDAFSDDALRMLRAVQFASRFGFTIEPKTMQMIKDNVERIKIITPERILIEFDKIVKKGDKRIGAQLLQDTGLFKQIFGYDLKASTIGRSDFEGVKTMAEFLFLLTRLLPEPAEFVKNTLKGDIQTYKQMKALQHAYAAADETDITKARTAAHNVFVTSKDMLQSQILPEIVASAAQDLLSDKYPKSLAELAVNGNDLMGAGLRGKEIGDAMKKMLLKIYGDEVRNTKEDLLSLIDKKPEDVEEGYHDYRDMKPSTWNVNGREVNIDFFVQEYYRWNTQGGKPGYRDASHESVLEFLQNNYEDFSVDNKLRKELYWELTDRNVLNEEPVKKVSYTAVVLDDQSHTKLVQVLGPMIPKDWKIYAHHMTINMGPIDNTHKDLLGESAELKVTSYAKDNLVMAVGVSGAPTINKIPHITVAVNTNAGGKPFLSNKLTDWKPLGFPLTLTGKVSEEE